MIREKLKLVPHLPGCYLMKNSDGNIIYVGKSKNLKNRLSSYFNNKHTGKTKMLVSDICDFEYIVTSSELESLLLEINLIKKYNPKYNILLRDDKTYPYIEYTKDNRLIVVRNPNIKRKKDLKLFGPYPNVTAARKVVDMLNRIYPLRKCKNIGNKVCLYYHIGECQGYCVNTINEEEIKKMKNEIISFLNGNHSIVTDKLNSLMMECSSKLQFEKAKEYKELLDYINITLEKQKVELDDNINRDIINYYEKDNYLSMQILFIRGGKLLDKKSDLFPMIDTLEEEITSYISKFYDKHQIKPKEVIVPDFIDKELLTNAFDLKFVSYQKGVKKKLFDLAGVNAKIYYEEQISLILREEDRTINAIKELGEILSIPNLSRIELFDNSNLFGTFNVSGMVVFIDGKPAKNEYRKFKITNDKNDDYNTMREVIYRRYYHGLIDKDLPDLILVDGGANQIRAAKEILEELSLNIKVCGLVKNNKHQTSDLLDGDTLEVYDIDRTSNLFHYLTRMQDEVHRFTITYHKQIRSKGSIQSLLDNIPGIGEKRRKELIKRFGSAKRIKEASLEELKEILPEEVASNLKKYLEKNL